MNAKTGGTTAASMLAALRQATGHNECQLPSGLSFTGTTERLTITLGAQAIGGNMQADGAAFEAWALAFLAHGCVQTVEIRLPEGLAVASGGERHYERLLYRMRRFADLFPEVVGVDPAALNSAKALTDGTLLLNQPLGPRPKPLPPLEPLMQKVRPPADPTESDLEFALEASPVFARTFGLDKVIRQWPVGVFRDKVAANNYIFTGGKSAIDLLGVSGSILYLFELKGAGNAKAGILSELLFYANVMRDALGPTPRFRFESRTPASTCAVTPADITACNRIEAVLLAPRFHPIVTPKLITYLNAALARSRTDLPVRFRTVTITDMSGADFELG